MASIANECDVGVLFAKTDPEAGARGETAFIVHPKEYPGWNATPIDTVGLSKSFRTCVVHLDDFVVPVEDRLAEEGEGFTIVMRALQPGRVTVAGKALGVARACFEDAVAYAQVRVLRGQPIGRYQMIQSEIAEMAVAIEASRALVCKAAVMMDNNLASNRMAALAGWPATAATPISSSPARARPMCRRS